MSMFIASGDLRRAPATRLFVPSNKVVSGTRTRTNASGLKIGHDEKPSPGAAFPAFETVNAIPAKRLRAQIAKKFGLSTASDPLAMVRELGARGLVREGVNARDAGFEVGEVLSEAGIAARDYVYLNWYRFDDIDRLRLRDFDARFENIWYPGSDDLDVFDDSLTWMLSIAQHGAVKLIRP
jgi:hypothetical protein